MRLEGISLKGKNRIREHGDEWAEVERAESAQCFNNEPALRVESPDGHTRWIRQHGDKDFRIKG